MFILREFPKRRIMIHFVLPQFQNVNCRYYYLVIGTILKIISLESKTANKYGNHEKY